MKSKVLLCDTMKILQVIQFFSSNHGGSAVVPYELSKNFQKRGHEVTVLTTDFQLNNDFIDSLEGVEVVFLHCQFSVGGFLVSPSINQYLEENIAKFDIIHVHNFRTYQNIIIHKYAKKHNIPYILQAHGSVMPFFSKQNLKKLFDLFFGYKILEDASKVIALTKTEVEQYKKMGVDDTKIDLIPNGIDLSAYKNLPDRGKFRKKYNIKTDEKLVLYLGRIHRIKGVDLLIEAFSDLIIKIDNVKLIIVGPDDGFLSELKAQIENLKIDNRVLFTGPLYGTDKLEAYIDADVYVLPSVYETFPVTVLEACACGTPVITTDRCCIADLIDGTVVEYNKERLSEAIIEILNSKDKQITFKSNSMECLEEKFEWSAIIPQMEKIYKNCVDASSAN